MGEYIALLCEDRSLTIVARIDEDNPWELRLMSVLKDE